MNRILLQITRTFLKL